MKVAVIRGGRSSEHPVSLRSGAAVGEGLRAAGYETVDVVIEPDGRWLAEGAEVELRAASGLLGCDVAFPVLHGPFGEDGTVQGLLECLDIPYVGPGVLAAAVTIDKLIFKRLLRERGIAQVDFCQAGEEGWRERAEALGLPVWVKPSRLGSSVGILKVAEPGGLDAAVASALEHDPRVIIEAHCTGLARCDFFVTDDGEVLVNELNTIPGFTETSVFAKLFEASGVDYPALCQRLVLLALERHESERGYRY
jgi:D-alanine-D-alanine ligase